MENLTRRIARAYLEVLREKTDPDEEKKKMDPVNKKALKKDFDDRKDKDIDNDGDVDSSDEYLHNRRKAVSKAMKKEEVELDEAINSSDYKVTHQKSQFGGYRPHVVHRKAGHSLYLGSQSYKTPKHAEGHADAYLKGYAAMNDKHADRKAKEYSQANKQHHYVKEVKEATQGPDDKTSDTWEKQLSTRKGEKDFVDMHKVETPDFADAEKVNQKTFADIRKSAPPKKKRWNDQDIGDKKPVPNDGK